MTQTAKLPIVVNGLNYWYGAGEARRQAIFDVSFSIECGNFTVLRGPSGCGKTTLLTLMGCLRNIQEGSIQLLGHQLHGTNASTQEKLRRQIGFIFQAHNLHESLTARQNTRMGLQVHGKSGSAARQDAAVTHLLTQLGLGDRLDYLPGQLSGGQKQRVAVARALVSNPDVVFADEPTAALDKQAGLQIVRMLKALGQKRGTTTVMVTHDTRIVELADTIIDMEDGRIIRNQIAERKRDE